MKLLLGLLGKLPTEWAMGLVAAGALALLATVGGAWAWADHQGYERADLQWRLKWAQYEYQLSRAAGAEMQRQAEVNEAAKRAEADAIANLERQLQQQEALVRELQEQADADPQANQVALDAEAVKRHNRRAGH